MRHIKIFISLIIVGLALSCHKLDGDNSEFDFGHKNNENTNPYKDGYGRLPNSLRLGTYNVHRCEGPGIQDPTIDRSHYDKTAAVLSRIDADVMALQEIDFTTTWHTVNQLLKLAELSGYSHYIEGPAINQRGGKYGNGILSKIAPTAEHNFILPNPKGTEVRACVVAEFSEIIFMATHFCHKEADNRTAQAAAINQYIEDNYAAETRLIYLAGDLNEASASSDMMVELQKKWKVISTNEFTTGQKRIDYVLIYIGNTPQNEVIGSTVPSWDDLDISTVSDHNPVMVDLKK